MARERTATEEQVADLLRTAKAGLDLSVAFLSRLDGTTQHLEVVESSVPFLFREGVTQPQATTFCQAILEGRLPAVIPDVRKHPEAMRLPAARMPRIRSYVSVPVVLSDGEVYGTFCAAGLTTDKALSKRDKALMEVLARAAALVIEPGVREAARRDAVEDRLLPLMAAGGPVVVLQPIVELATGDRVGAEALSRFPRDWEMAPDVVFDQAHSVGHGDRLELLALERAAEHLAAVDGYVSMNVSPATLLTPECTALLRGLPLPRVLLELSEHDQVDDYDALRAVLQPLREQGMRLAIDDVGAGFSSLRHIVLTTPEVIKLDRTLVDGVAGDPVLRTLVTSLVAFAHGCDASVVAEGVETAEDAAVLLAAGVDHGQGWHFGRPGPASDLGPVPLREQMPAQRDGTTGSPELGVSPRPTAAAAG
jgi:EAL domain-containing protein (putative c-di-GMP-specific phosphodiesterase class I)